MCSATKGAQDMGTCFTDVSSTNGYWSTLYCSVPWRWTPAYALLDGFNIRQIFPDLLHVWHLGVCRDLIGSACRLMLDAGVWGDGSIETKLQNATADLKSFAASHKLPLKLKKLSKSKLAMNKNKYPELKSSGYDSYVVLRWLLGVCENRAALIPDRIKTCLWAGNHVMSVLTDAEHFLTASERQNRTVVGYLFLTSYMSLAHEEVQRGRLLFRIRPKYHLLQHICMNPSSINAGKYATWMDEDGLKKLMRIMRRTDSRTAEHRVLQRWLLSLYSVWKDLRQRAGA